MANNFRLTGTYYVSKDGSDANSGLTADLPKLTVQAALTLVATGGTIIVGAGVYREALAKASNTAASFTIRADGHVVFEGDGVNAFTLSSSNAGSPITVNLTVIGVEVRNYAMLFAVNSQSANVINFIWSNCIIKSPLRSDGTASVGNATCRHFLTNCIAINTNFNHTTGTANGGSIIDSILINVDFQNNARCGDLRGTYVDPTSFVMMYSVTAAVGTCNYNNIEGGIAWPTATAVTTGTYQDIAGNYYDLTIATSTGSGTIGDPFGRPYTAVASFPFAAHRALYPTINTYSFDADPLFNDAANLNFTLQSSSPHILANHNYRNIGGTDIAVYKAADGTWTLTNLDLIGDAITIAVGQTSGTALSEPIEVQWPIVKGLSKLEFTGGLEFSKSITGGLTGNNNVPAVNDYVAATQGAKPARLTVRMRFSTQEIEPATSGEWDNGGYWTAGDYEVFELNAKPKIDSQGKGNGNPDYIETTALGDVLASWVQIEVTLRDDY
jgi:hypothetical protein